MLRNTKITLLFLALTIRAVAAINPPDLRCISVSLNGDVTINWIPPADPLTEFANYTIFKSSSLAGTYTVIATINTYSINTYTDANAGGNSVFYYINGPGFSAASDTLQSILLSVTNIGTGKIASLTWNPIHNPQLPSSTALYYIYREYPTGIWTKIDSTTSLSYKDTISYVCTSTLLNYYIEIADLSGCLSRSNIKGENFFDQTPPQKTFLKSVSVDPLTGIVSISWFENGSKDTKKYIIYKVVGGIKIPIDTVHGITNTNYVNTNSKADSSSENYDIATLDSCGGTGNLSDSIHSTIFAKVFPSRCDGSDSLVWNKYNHMPSGVDKYNIYVSVNNGPYTLLASTPASDTTFTNTGLINLSTYCYYIEAVNLNGNISSTSNQICITANIAQVPTFLYLRKATILSKNSVNITGHTDINGSIWYYIIKRSDNAAGPYDSIGQIPYSSTPTIVFIDTTANTGAQSYYYKLTAVDSCGNEKLTSNIGRTIFLEVTADIAGHSNLLNWNEYEQWLGTVSSYNIYRSLDGIFDAPPIANIPSSGTSYTHTDDILNILEGEGVFYYAVEAVEGIGNSYGFQDSSFSNVSQAIHNAFIYIPNAFTPSGMNPIFIPAITYVSKSDYLFEIFDRWGGLVFSTHDPAAGWDGTYKSNECDRGVYVYKLKLKDSFNNPFEKKGIITLIR